MKHKTLAAVKQKLKKAEPRMLAQKPPDTEVEVEDQDSSEEENEVESLVTYGLTSEFDEQ